jgi:hypothetical protein
VGQRRSSQASEWRIVDSRSFHTKSARQRREQPFRQQRCADCPQKDDECKFGQFDAHTENERTTAFAYTDIGTASRRVIEHLHNLDGVPANTNGIARDVECAIAITRLANLGSVAVKCEAASRRAIARSA